MAQNQCVIFVKNWDEYMKIENTDKNRRVFRCVSICLSRNAENAHNFPQSTKSFENVYRVNKNISCDDGSFMEIELYICNEKNKEKFISGKLLKDNNEYIIDLYVLYSHLQIGIYCYDNIGICIINDDSSEIHKGFFC